MKIWQLSTIGLAVLLTACTNNVNLQSDVAIPQSYSQTKETRDTSAITNFATWWLNWHNPELNRLISLGLEHNKDLALAKACLNEIGANYDLAKANRRPQVGASAKAMGAGSNVEAGNYTPDSTTNYGLYGGITASWELDIFGAKTADKDAAYHTMLKTQQEMYGTQLLITANIAQAYFTAQAYKQQKTLVSQQVASLKQLLSYVQGRFQAGKVTSFEVQQVEKQLAATQAQLEVLQANVDTQVRNLAILTGQVPQSFSVDLTTNSLASLPAVPYAGQPSDLLDRRPDLQAAYEQVQAAAAKLASAKADLYPRFTIDFSGFLGRIQLSNQMDYLTGSLASGGIGVSLPIFTAGRIKANINAANARLQQALISYDKTLLQALADVDNAYQMQYALEQQSKNLTQAVKLAQKQVTDAKLMYQYGAKTLDQVLNTIIDSLNYQTQLLNSQLQQAINMLSLYKALGGGW
ncbi:efflux transporter outer membrane subunit [Psittacicella hinzii]|uniref:Uncharacterized protein n=1 Tax=Psittacicella hinzii TaxID=2028575 RepID=A0A3A1YPC4_9GAMM|nr:TolC family protein [Psittacicella hinzii]RIY39465.1 hypothetical protein CKF58_02050 [Psittacicella hinzii]